MSEFWGFDGADIVAIIMIMGLCGACLYHARHWSKEL